MMLTALFPLLALVASPQDGASEGGWYPHNGVRLIVNENCITIADIERRVMRLGRNVSTDEDRRDAYREVTGDEIDRHLKVGAGRDIGFDSKMVKSIVDSQHRARLERAKSTAGLADALAESQIDSARYTEDMEADVLSMLWTRSVVGHFPGPAGRHYVDRYVRPGRLKYESERRENNLSLSTLVKVQQLASQLREAGTLESARQLAERCREEILAGADFGQVAVDNGCAAEDTRGVGGPYELDVLMQVPGLAEFLQTAQPDDVSEVLPIRNAENLIGFRVVKLLELEEKTAPSFVNEEYQQLLTRDILEILDRGREDLAVGKLLRAAYVWPPEAFGRGPKTRE